jgi:FkbH-like protein
MRDLKYSEILKLNAELSDASSSVPYNITVLSNITVHQIKEILEYGLRSETINANIDIGDYDNIIQGSLKFQESSAVILMWELCNIVDGLPYKIELFDENQFNDIFEKIKGELKLVFNNLDKVSLVLVNKFSSLSFSNSNIGKNNFEKLKNQLNRYLEDILPTNSRLLDLDKMITDNGTAKSFDLRYYYSSKALYTVDFFKTYTEHALPFFRAANGKAKKALIFDCDNTLWKGVLGEDGFDHIEMSPQTKSGAIFFEIQSLARALSKQGVLIGLCSKNNYEDVMEVVRSHPDMQLREEHLSIVKSNWQDKISNLKEISNELNIGLDSIVFIDDSSFEVNLVEENLPEVTTLQVPKKLYEYSRMLRNYGGLFYNLSLTVEDSKKTEGYQQQIQRVKEKSNFVDIEDYLTSLELKMTLHQNDDSIIPRMSQMSLKTNQFNLTTKRYTDRDIESFIRSDSFEVFAFSIADKYGDSGITGMCIVEVNEQEKQAKIDTFLLSCRVIGRNIEYAFMDYLINHLQKREYRSVISNYVKTLKNSQVLEFYETCSYRTVNVDELTKNYELIISDYQHKNKKYIEIKDGKN